MFSRCWVTDIQRCTVADGSRLLPTPWCMSTELDGIQNPDFQFLGFFLFFFFF